VERAAFAGRSRVTLNTGADEEDTDDPEKSPQQTLRGTQDLAHQSEGKEDDNDTDQERKRDALAPRAAHSELLHEAHTDFGERTVWDVTVHATNEAHEAPGVPEDVGSGAHQQLDRPKGNPEAASEPGGGIAPRDGGHECTGQLDEKEDVERDAGL